MTDPTQLGPSSLFDKEVQDIKQQGKECGKISARGFGALLFAKVIAWFRGANASVENVLFERVLNGDTSPAALRLLTPDKIESLTTQPSMITGNIDELREKLVKAAGRARNAGVQRALKNLYITAVNQASTDAKIRNLDHFLNMLDQPTNSPTSNNEFKDRLKIVVRQITAEDMGRMTEKQEKSLNKAKRILGIT